MRRRLFSILAIGSAVLFLTAIVFWVRSCWIVDMVNVAAAWNTGQRLRGDAVGIESWNARAEITLGYLGPGSTRLGKDGMPVKPGVVSCQHLPLKGFSWTESQPTWAWAGFYSASAMSFGGVAIIDINRPDAVTRHYGAPYWFILAITGFLPFGWTVRVMRRRNRPVHGLCARCGYDLRASTNRCPECGAAVAMPV
jgi:hypothetical protein